MARSRCLTSFAACLRFERFSLISSFQWTALLGEVALLLDGLRIGGGLGNCSAGWSMVDWSGAQKLGVAAG